jgi:hypothetical protein
MNPDVGRDLPLLRQLDHVHGPTDRQGMLSFAWLVQEELSVAERRFGVLINSHARWASCFHSDNRRHQQAYLDHLHFDRGPR